ncbi:MAG: zinc ribbon domain-containing protein [Chloroflexota bacterium]|nr:zinc ribbon domain-containing protein [Chloroflexota bacterium]MDE2909432.1 zinc ribbon domain-containing protein [Chloroflexota bacterium]
MPEGFDDILLVATVFVVVTLAAFWLALVIWAYRDMRSRSRDPLAQLLVAIIVLLLNVPGLFVYILLRPRATLSETYERSLEEEALLQEIEERPTCPGCGQRVQHDWQACPHCYHRLKKACVNCDYLLELPWNICPRCTTSQVNYTSDGTLATASRHVKPSEPAPIDAKWVASQQVE